MCEHHPQPQDLLVQGLEPEAFQHAEACGSCRATLLAHRAYPPGCSQPLLGYRLQLHLDVLLRPGGEHPALRAHLAECPACQIELAEGAEVLAELTPPDPSRMTPTCAQCGDLVPRLAAVSCATCTSPHHADCFDALGCCGLEGCRDERYVRSLGHGRPPLGRWLLGGLLGLVVAAALGEGSVSSHAVSCERRGLALPSRA